MGCVGSLLAIFCSIGICSHLKWRLQSNPEAEQEWKPSDPEGQCVAVWCGLLESWRDRFRLSSSFSLSLFNPLWNSCCGFLIRDVTDEGFYATVVQLCVFSCYCAWCAFWPPLRSAEAAKYAKLSRLMTSMIGLTTRVWSYKGDKRQQRRHIWLLEDCSWSMGFWRVFQVPIRNPKWRVNQTFLILNLVISKTQGKEGMNGTLWI